MGNGYLDSDQNAKTDYTFSMSRAEAEILLRLLTEKRTALDGAGVTDYTDIDVLDLTIEAIGSQKPGTEV